MLTALVESGADINLPFPDGSYPIHMAVFSGRHETVLFLLNKNSNVKQKRNVCLGGYVKRVYNYSRYRNVKE